MSYSALFDLDPEAYLVVDRETGTVLGTNLVVINTKNLSEEQVEEIVTNDSVAADYADNPEYSHPLWVEDTLV